MISICLEKGAAHDEKQPRRQSSDQAEWDCVHNIDGLMLPCVCSQVSGRRSFLKAYSLKLPAKNLLPVNMTGNVLSQVRGIVGIKRIVAGGKLR